MFAGFNLNIDIETFKEKVISGKETFECYKTIGEKKLEEKKINIEKKLKDYILNGTINGKELQENWFPIIPANIFISHSHKDRDFAFALSGWLYCKFGLECFIDSGVWGYINDLLSEINDEFSDKKQKSDGRVVYNHEKCNIASAHVNMMLNIALQEIIDNTEAVFLINTPNSIDKYDGQASTLSPWIYSEIIATKLIRKKSLLEYRGDKEYFFESSEIKNSLKIKYDITIDHLTKLNCSNLLQWDNTWKQITNNKKYPLDQLYRITNEEKVKF